MARVASRDGDVDGVINVLSKDLSDAHAYIEIVNICREHRRYDDALRWAHLGVEAFKGERFAGLEMLLAEELRRAGKYAEAVEIVWRFFTDRPSMNALKVVLDYAKPLKQQEHWHDMVVGHLRKTMAKESDWQAMGTRTLLVEIYLSEGNTHMAVQEADCGKCSWETLTKLAETCAKERKEDAFRIYTRVVPEILQSTTHAYSTPNHRYKQAADLIKRAAKLAGLLSRTRDFQQWYADIRTQYKRKRNLMKLLANVRP